MTDKKKCEQLDHRCKTHYPRRWETCETLISQRADMKKEVVKAIETFGVDIGFIALKFKSKGKEDKIDARFGQLKKELEVIFDV